MNSIRAVGGLQGVAPRRMVVRHDEDRVAILDPKRTVDVAGTGLQLLIPREG